LLDGETVEWDHGERRRKIRFLNPELGLINIDDPIPLHISAFGPRGRRLTAGIRDAHWMASIPNVDIAVTGIGDMHDAWRAAGKDPSDFYTTAISSGTVLDENEPFDSPRAKAEAGPPAALVLHKMAEDAEYGGLHYEPPGFLKRQFEKYREIHRSYEPADARYLAAHRGHLLFLRADEEALITGEMIEAMTITGTREALRDSIRELKRAGYSQFSAHIRFGHDDALERWADVFELV
jgi:5,10-methylenetetrahydromethanopterin reductase